MPRFQLPRLQLPRLHLPQLQLGDPKGDPRAILRPMPKGGTQSEPQGSLPLGSKEELRH